MLYQKLLTGNKPYFISANPSFSFEVHRHPEIELSYCTQGAYTVRCENREYVLSAGDIVVIHPMTAHEVIQLASKPGQMITIELGPTLLGDAFALFANQSADCWHYKPSCCRWHHRQSAANLEVCPTRPMGLPEDLHNKPENGPDLLYQTLIELIEESVLLHRASDAFAELALKGNLYKISALLLQMSHDSSAPEIPVKRKNDVQKIDKALAIIYDRYFEPLGIEELSALCGYSKSNFCKIFKDITGDTFHATLNRHRIEIACLLLRESNSPVEKIALETGFSDIKSFCRVFKKIKGESAGAYRKRHQ